MPKPTEPPAVIRISANTILDGKFYNRGEPLPFSKVEDLPPNLKPYVVTAGELEEDEEPEGARGSFQLNTPYEVTPDDRLGRKVRRRVERQIADLEAVSEEQDWIEEEADAPLPEEVASALEEAHEDSVARQAAQLGVNARTSDDLADAVAADAEPPRLYVKRGSRHYAPAVNARLKASESVFTRNPEGRFEYVGIVNGDGELPDLPIQL